MLEDKLSARDIVAQVGMSSKPEFYTGRGATLIDLNSKRLEDIYQLIKNNPGNDAANSFIQLIAHTPVLSATYFLVALYKLEESNWVWNKKFLDKELFKYVSDRETTLQLITGAEKVDETKSIRKWFLRDHKIMLAEDWNMRESWGLK